MAQQLFGDAAVFPATMWSLVDRAGDDADVPRQRAALGQLLERYIPPMRTHLMSRWHLGADDADDLLQSFLADRVIERNILSRADRARGKFRTFLLTALDNSVRNALAGRMAKKRHPAQGLGVLQAGMDCPAPQNGVDHAFDLAWARQVLSQAVQRMSDQCGQNARDDMWGVFQGRVLQPLLDGTLPQSYETLVRRYSFASPAQASNVLINAKRLFERCLRAVVSEYAAGEQAVEQELTDLREILSRGA